MALMHYTEYDHNRLTEAAVPLICALQEELADDISVGEPTDEAEGLIRSLASLLEASRLRIGNPR